jgi:hypothetical protein
MVGEYPFVERCERMNSKMRSCFGVRFMAVLGFGGGRAEEAVQAMATGAGRGKAAVVFLQAVAGGCLEGKPAVAVDDVFGEVAARAEDDERFVGGGGEERAKRGKELHG